MNQFFTKLIFMKTIFFLAFTCISLSLISCKDDSVPVAYDYHAHIMQPSSADKSMGDILFIQVEFESHTGEAVEHIQVRIFNKATLNEVYKKPSDAHVAGGPSVHEFQDQVELIALNGFSPGDWVIEAKVWGHDEGQDEEAEQVEFHIHP